MTLVLQPVAMRLYCILQNEPRWLHPQMHKSNQRGTTWEINIILPVSCFVNCICGGDDLSIVDGHIDIKCKIVALHFIETIHFGLHIGTSIAAGHVVLKLFVCIFHSPVDAVQINI